jgi:hypothetical protein
MASRWWQRRQGGWIHHFSLETERAGGSEQALTEDSVIWCSSTRRPIVAMIPGMVHGTSVFPR